jgi:uncharacterized protein (TIGR02996 family)
VIAPELLALLQACKDEPDEEAPRLVLADWLEEHGQTDRAEFVRLQLRLAREDVPAGDEAVSLARLHELYLRHADEWLGALRDQPERCGFRRGLIEMRAHVRDQPPSKVVPQVGPWLETLVLDFGQQKAVKELLGSHWLASFSSLDVSRVKMAGAMLANLGTSQAVAHLRRLCLELAPPVRPAASALAQARHLGGLKVLVFQDGLGDGHLQALAGTSLLANLSTLKITLASLTRKGDCALARSAHAPRLACLDWSHFHVGEPALAELARSPVLSEIRDLRLQHRTCARTDVRALAQRPEWPRLERLSFEASYLEDVGVAALASLSGFPALRRLNLGRCNMTANGLRSLLAAPWLAQLERLNLQGADLDEDGAVALARCPNVSGLRSLDLRGCKINAEGALALARSPHLARLETLALGSNPLGDAGLAALADTDCLPAVTSLGLNGTELTSSGLARLARSRLAGQLRRLELVHNRLSGLDLQALHSPQLAGLRDLFVGYNLIGEEGVRVLAQGPFCDIVRLDLMDNWHERGQKKGAEALFSTHGFPSLALLNLSGRDITPEFMAALRTWPRLHQMASLNLGWLPGYGLGSLRRSPAFCLD